MHISSGNNSSNNVACNNYNTADHNRKCIRNQNQAASQANDCENGPVPIDTVFCQNLAAQIQGDYNSPSMAASQSPQPETPPTTTTATVTVIKIVECQAGQQCPNLPDPLISRWTYPVCVILCLGVSSL